MGEKTKVEWCDHTFSPWRGCSKVSPGCAHCYAERQSKRNPAVLGVWGDQGTRVVASETYWRQPLKWDRDAAAAGERRRVFCASIADVFEDRPELAEPRARLFRLIDETEHLDWLLLTKRPENIVRLTPPFTVTVKSGRKRVSSSHAHPNPFPHETTIVEHGRRRDNVWLGTSVENQACADERVWRLLETPAAVHFLSMEPLLAPVVLHKYFAECRCGHGHGFTACPNTGGVSPRCHVAGCGCQGLRPLIDWVIVGGESGPGARPCRLEWVRSLVAQCRAAGVPCFVKQLGANVPLTPTEAAGVRRVEPADPAAPFRLRLRDPKGGDPSEWAADLRVRQFPEVARA